MRLLKKSSPRAHGIPRGPVVSGVEPVEESQNQRGLRKRLSSLLFPGSGSEWHVFL